MHRWMPLSASLAAALLVAVAAGQAYSTWDLITMRRAEVSSDARDAFAYVSAERQRIVGGIENMLSGIAIDAAGASSPEGCRHVQAAALGRFQPRIRIDVLDADGGVTCSTDINAARADTREAGLVARSLDTGRAMAGDFIPATPALPGVLPFVAPWQSGTGGSARGVVLAVLDPRWLDDVFSRRPLPRSALFLMADARGSVIASNPAGISGSMPPGLSGPLATKTSGMARMPWLDGTRRYVAYGMLGDDAPFTYAAIAIDESVSRTGTKVTSLELQAVLAIALAAAIVSLFLSFLRPRPKVAVWADTPSGSISGRKWKAVLDSWPEPVLIRDAEGACLYANPGAAECLGIEASRAVGMDETGMAPSDGEGVASARRQVMETGKPVTRRANVINLKNGGGRNSSVTYFPVRDADGVIAAVGVVSRDASADVEAEEALRAARQRASETERAKTRFLASVSHDLRQPAQASLMFADALSLAPGDPDAHSNLTKSLETLGGMLDSMLDISRLDSGSVAPEIADFPLHALLSEIRDSYEPAALTKGIGLVVVETAAVVRSDRVLVGRILRNITENAIRYTSAGRVLVDCVSRQDGQVLVRVVDSGIGIPPEDRERIWDEFHQLRNPERDRGRGLGLGLAIVKRAAALLGCEITLESAPGEGSTFAILLPSGTMPAALPGPASAVPPPARTVSAADGRRRILVVEDDPVLLDGLRRVLSARGYDVAAARDGADALATVSGGFIPDVIVADYRLPGRITGSSVIVTLRKVTGRFTPAILLTGENGPEPENDAVEFGYRLLRKPVPPSALLNLIGGILEPPPSG